MTVHTALSLKRARRRLDNRINHIERAEFVLAEMKRGASLHLQHTRRGDVWALSSGRIVHPSIAKMVIASASVVGVGDSLFPADRRCLAQTWRWWNA